MYVIEYLTHLISQNWGTYPEHPAIIAAELITNLGIAIAFFMIPVALWRFTQRFEALPFRSVWVMFVIFILACGTSYLTRVASLFLGGWVYWVDVAVCTATLVASLGTAIGLVRHGPRIAMLSGRLLQQQR
jgi:hypothetical protein